MTLGYVIKLKGSELALTTNNTVNSASLVRITNNNAANVTISQFSNTGGTVGTCTVITGNEILIQKLPTDTLQSSAAVQAVSVSFRD